MKIKTNELIDITLDWAVASIEGAQISIVVVDGIPEIWDNEDIYDNFKGQDCYCNRDGKPRFIRDGKPVGLWGNPMKSYLNWSQGGPIIERERILIEPHSGNQWCATYKCPDAIYDGHTPLIAAMRAYVASKLGDEIEIPEELK